MSQSYAYIKEDTHEINGTRFFLEGHLARLQPFSTTFPLGVASI